MSNCEELVEETADLVVAVADHAAASEGGLPPAALEAPHPDDFDAWEIMAALAVGSDQLEVRVATAQSLAAERACPPGSLYEAIETRVQDEFAERGERLSENFNQDEYAAMTLMAVTMAAFEPAPSPAPNLPPGFPDEFPAHPDAQLVNADVSEDGSISATWQVDGDFADVADFYLNALQEGRLGGWDAPRIHGSESEGLDGQTTGRQLLEITGYGFTGEVEVTGEDSGIVTILARLSARD